MRRLQRTKDINGESAFFLARALGHTSIAQRVEATAAYSTAFRGFVANGCRLEILPFTLDLETWQDLDAGQGDDNWTWDPVTETVTSGPDGIPETNLFPQDYGMPGNRGTVDIGHAGNSTNDIKRQILDGISESDLEFHGGTLEFDANGEIILNGDTGISAAVKTQLTEIIGEPRIIPIFVDASGNGNNADYTIQQFVGMRIMEVKLTGKMDKKRVIVQPAAIRTNCGISDSSTMKPQTTHIFSNVILLR